MTRQPDDAFRYVEDILNEMQIVQDLVEDLSFAEFEEDQRTRRAVVRCLEVIGEAAKQVPDEVRDRHDRVPWREMAGMRDRLIHAYRDVDLELVWQAITEEIPEVQPHLVAILEEEAPSS